MRRKRHQVLHFSMLYITLLLLGSIGKLQGEKKNRSPSAVGGTISAPTSSDKLRPTSEFSQNHQEGTNSLGKKQSQKPKDRTPSLNRSSKKSSPYIFSKTHQNTTCKYVQETVYLALGLSLFPNLRHQFPVTALFCWHGSGSKPRRSRINEVARPKWSEKLCLQMSSGVSRAASFQLYSTACIISSFLIVSFLYVSITFPSCDFLSNHVKSIL